MTIKFSSKWLIAFYDIRVDAISTNTKGKNKKTKLIPGRGGDSNIEGTGLFVVSFRGVKT